MTPAAATIRRWRESALVFATEELGFVPDKWQREFLLVLPSQKKNEIRISLQACVGPGKTAVLAIANLWFIVTQGDKDEHPKGACVSITEDNLRANLWPELAKWQARSEYLRTSFTWTKGRFSSNDHPRTWFIEARTWSKKADRTALGRTLSGLHAKYVMVTLDESGDMPVQILLSGEQILSNYTWAKILQAGNPSSLDGALYHAATTARHLWKIIRITGDPDDKDRSPRIDIDNAREQIKMYTRDNPWIMYTILGQFPPAAINSLLGVEEVQEAMRRHLRTDQYDWAQKRIGVDVARFGNDRSCGFPRQGMASFRPFMLRKQRTTVIAARVAQAVNTWEPDDQGSVLLMVDDTGHWGHGVIDVLFEAHYSPHAVIYHSDAIDPRYKNLTTEMHFRMAEWVKSGGALPDDPELLAELTSRTYTFIGGKLALEDKGIAKARLGRSPDKSDALANTFALPDMPKMRRRGKSESAAADFDPFRNIGDNRAEEDDFDPQRDSM